MNGIYKIQELNHEDVEICANCRNAFKIELIKESSDYNDFGSRFCPFCGSLTNAFAHVKKQHRNPNFIY